MNKRILALTMVFGMFIVVTSVNSQEAGRDTNAVEEVHLKPQTHCPVMGGKIDSTVYADMQGQRIYFCCPGCVERFKKDPEKYFLKAAEEGILFENIQTTCPVSGDPIDGDIFIYYKGRGIHFCCQNCASTFRSDPDTYLNKLDEMPEESKDKTKVEKKDHGHKH